jgi:pimeloyl-ACP methyl ester carboxylesterase
MLDRIRVPAMGMYGDKDIIVHPLQWKPMQAGIAQARIERFPKAGHFIMLDDPNPFMLMLKDFLNEGQQTV